MNTEIRNNDTPCRKEQEIDLIDLIQKLWSRRKLILKITGCFIVIGLLFALFSAKEYMASCEIVPQTSKNITNASIARFASLAGINMGSMTSGEQALSPMVYPNILQSAALQRELLQTQINIEDEPESITLLSYLSDKKYQSFSLSKVVMKYTIGLPGLIVRADKGQQIATTGADNQIITLSKEEQEAILRLEKIISISLEEKIGLIKLEATMPEPVAAAQLTENTLILLQKYITEFKIDKVQNNLEFIQGRYDELKKEYEDMQMARARFKDSNMNTSSSRVRTELEKLDNQYTLAYGIFSEIAAQLEQAKIQVKETTPIFTVINPVTVPMRPSKPQRIMILMGFTFFGVISACGYVLIAPFLLKTFGTIRRKEDEENS